MDRDQLRMDLHDYFRERNAAKQFESDMQETCQEDVWMTAMLNHFAMAVTERALTDRQYQEFLQKIHNTLLRLMTHHENCGIDCSTKVIAHVMLTITRSTKLGCEAMLKRKL